MVSPQTKTKYIQQAIHPWSYALYQSCVSQIKPFQYGLIVPAFAEIQYLPTLLQSLEKTNHESSCLLVLVLNAPMHASPEDMQATQACSNFIHDTYHCTHTYATMQASLHQASFGQILCCRLYQNETTIASQEGVGTVRKIGSDLAWLLHTHALCNQPFLLNTDADAQLPQNYFQAVQHVQPTQDPYFYHKNIAAILYPFTHAHDNTIIQTYEQSLHHYVNNLHKAGSPYAFQTVGSTIAVHVEAYAQVRGWPHRQAGEDFYFLNKLRKTNQIISLENPSLVLSGRSSHRVPFGTGAAISKALNQGILPNFYPELCFTQLNHFLNASLMYIQNPETSFKHYLSQQPNHEFLLTWAEQNGAYKAYEQAAQQTKNLKNRSQRIHAWFDAFRTLKFIHAVRDDR